MTAPSNTADKDAIGEIAGRHGFGPDAGTVMATALDAGGGAMAQFNHPEFGGMGQWSRGGMVMIGDMFNDQLKGRVKALADDLSEAARDGSLRLRAPGSEDASDRASQGSGQWWPEDLGQPSAGGSQNDQRYAVFPNLRRLAVERDGRVTVHDTGEHRISGVSQQQGGRSDLSFSSQNGTVRLEDLPTVKEADAAPPAASHDRQAANDSNAASDDAVRDEPPAEARGGSGGPDGDIPAMIRKLAELKDHGILTEEEFAAKKKTLLDRL